MELDRNRFATCRLDPARGVLELEWTDASADMTDEDFRAGIERLATLAVEHGAPNVLVDVTDFRHAPAEDFGPWRDANIIPKYNAAGVTMAERDPGGIRYASLRLADGVSFVHLVRFETEDGSNPLGEIAAFSEFTRDIAERCDEPPATQDATVVGSYRFFGG